MPKKLPALVAGALLGFAIGVLPAMLTLVQADPPRRSSGSNWNAHTRPTYSSPSASTNFPRNGAYAYQGSGSSYYHNHSRSYPYHRYGRGYSNTNVFLGVNPFGYGNAFGTPLYGTYGLSSYYYGVSPYGTYYAPGVNVLQYNLPSVYYPGELAYGPQAVKQFVGVDRDFALRPLLEQPAAQNERPLILVPEKDQANQDNVVEPRRSNPETVALAVRLEDAGDALFVDQRYHEAAQRYKDAAETAPDYGVCYIKLALAYAATGRYENAFAALERGNALNDLGSVKLSLDDLYGENQIAKQSHMEALAQNVLDNPTSAKEMFLLAMFLHFDGQQERAQKFFSAAAKLAQ